MLGNLIVLECFLKLHVILSLTPPTVWLVGLAMSMGNAPMLRYTRRIQDRFRRYSCVKLFLRKVIVMNDALKESNPKVIETRLLLGVIELSWVQFIVV